MLLRHSFALPRPWCSFCHGCHADRKRIDTQASSCSHHQGLYGLPDTQENAVAGNAFVVPDDKACLQCHGSYEAIAKRTAGGEEPNPHMSNLLWRKP